jgi:hypothetical protein
MGEITGASVRVQPASKLNARSTGGWLVKECLFPLTPFLLSAFVRWLFVERAHWSVFDAKDLSITMSLFCVLVVTAAHKHRDPDLGSSLASAFLFGMFFFTALFVSAIVIETWEASAVADAHYQLSNHTSNISDLLASLNKNQLRLGAIESAIRSISAVLAVITVAMAVLCRIIYDLRD